MKVNVKEGKVEGANGPEVNLPWLPCCAPRATSLLAAKEEDKSEAGLALLRGGQECG